MPTGTYDTGYPYPQSEIQGYRARLFLENPALRWWKQLFRGVDPPQPILPSILMSSAPSFPRILLIEDDENLRLVLQQALEMGGYHVTTAGNGLEADALLGVQFFHLVITDLVMPQKEGIETIMDLRQKCPITKIIAMSGGTIGKNQDYLVMAGKLGAHRMLEKPFGLQVLMHTVRDLLES